MRTLKSILLLGTILLIGVVQSAIAQNKQEQREEKERQIKACVESGFFTIEIVRALPMTGSPVNLTSSYTLEMRGDLAVSHLPYFGRAYSIPYGGGDGLHFSEEVTNKKLTFDDKGVAELTFEVRTEDDNFTYTIKIYPNGSATIFVQPVNRQSISFHGDLAESPSPASVD